MMALKLWEAVTAAIVIFVAWGYLVDWIPLLSYILYSFVAGICVTSIFCTLALGTSVRATTHSSVISPDILKISRPRFQTQHTWIEQCRYLNLGVQHDQNLLFSTYPQASQSIQSLLSLIYESFILSWYRRISPDPKFAGEIDQLVRNALIKIAEIVQTKDVTDDIVMRILPLMTNHLREFYGAERTVRGINLNRHVTESEELDAVIAGKYRGGKLHAAASLKSSDLTLLQQNHVRRMLGSVMPSLITKDILQSRTVQVLIQELITCAVVVPLLQLLSDPDTWNQAIETYGRSILQDRKTVKKLRAALDQHASPPPKQSKAVNLPKLLPDDDERRFERFVRAIRQCKSLSDARRFRSEVAMQLRKEIVSNVPSKSYVRRLEVGKQLLDRRVGQLSALGAASTGNKLENSHQKHSYKLPDTSLREVLYNAAGLSYFMEFMDRRQVMSIVQFWLVVDSFRNPLEDDGNIDDPFIHTQSQWTDSDSADLAQIDKMYLCRAELDLPIDTKDAVEVFLDAGPDATISQYVSARAAVMRAQLVIYKRMEDQYFPDFKRSDLFYKYMTADTNKGAETTKQGATDPPISTLSKPSFRPALQTRALSAAAVDRIPLRRSRASSGDLSHIDGLSRGEETRLSLDTDNKRASLFGDDTDPDFLTRSIHSVDAGSHSSETAEAQNKIVTAMEAALTTIMTTGQENDRAELENKSLDPSDLPSGILDQFGNATELDAARSVKKGMEKPNIASLGLVNTSSRIGVFRDNDLFGDEEKFLEDEMTDSELSADEKANDAQIHEASPGDLGLAEAITVLTNDIDRLSAQDTVVETLTRKAELTNNVAELRILGKSKASLEREIRRKELQRQQYIVQESDNSLYGQASISIKSTVVAHEPEGHEFAVYMIEVQRNAGEHMPAASWVVARRYSEFHDLNQRLRQVYSDVKRMEFPRRRLVTKLQRDVLHKRRSALELYLQALLQIPAVCRSRDLRAFLSQSAIVSVSERSTDMERKDIVSRLYNSVTDGMDEFLGNVPMLDQISIAGQNLISAATSQLGIITTSSNMSSVGNESMSTSLSIAAEDPLQTPEARAEVLAFAPSTVTHTKLDQVEPFVKPICDLFLEVFDLQRGNNWLRGRAVVVVLHQLLGGTVERRIRDTVNTLCEEAAVTKYVDLLKENLWPDGILRQAPAPRTKQEKLRTRAQADVILATLIPDLAGNVVGKMNAQAAARRIQAIINNKRLMIHLILILFDEIIAILFGDISNVNESSSD